MMSPLPTETLLPNEIVREIFQCLDGDIKSLKACRLVNKQWNFVSTEILQQLSVPVDLRENVKLSKFLSDTIGIHHLDSFEYSNFWIKYSNALWNLFYAFFFYHGLNVRKIQIDITTNTDHEIDKFMKLISDINIQKVMLLVKINLLLRDSIDSLNAFRQKHNNTVIQGMKIVNVNFANRDMLRKLIVFLRSILQLKTLHMRYRYNRTRRIPVPVLGIRIPAFQNLEEIIFEEVMHKLSSYRTVNGIYESAYPNLRKVVLDSIVASPRDFIKLPSVTELTLKDTNLDGIQIYEKFPSLKILKVDFCGIPSYDYGPGLEAFLEELYYLNEFHFKVSPDLPKDGMKILNRFWTGNDVAKYLYEEAINDAIQYILRNSVELLLQTDYLNRFKYLFIQAPISQLMMHSLKYLKNLKGLDISGSKVKPEILELIKQEYSAIDCRVTF